MTGGMDDIRAILVASPNVMPDVQSRLKSLDIFSKSGHFFQSLDSLNNVPGDKKSSGNQVES